MLYYDALLSSLMAFMLSVLKTTYRKGVSGRTANEITGQEHLEVLALAANYVVVRYPKCNIGDDVPYEDFKTLFMMRETRLKVSQFRAAGKR